MSKDQKGFIVYGDTKALADELTDEQLGQLFRGMLSYFVEGKAPKFTGVLKFAFIPIKQQMDRDSVKYEKRCEKNRANANKRWNDMQSDAIAYVRMQSDAIDANTNTNINTNTNTETNTESAETDVSSLSSSLIRLLNEQTGSRYKSGPNVERLVSDLLASGYTGTDMEKVVRTKCLEWKDSDKMRPYLRPATLFGPKFSEYVSAPVSLVAIQAKKNEVARDQLARELEEKRAALEAITSSIEEIPRDESGRLGDKLDEYRLLCDQRAILEDSINKLTKQIGGQYGS